MDELPPIVETDTSSFAYSGRDAEYISGYEAGFVQGEEYMQEKMRAYAAAAVARERERCALAVQEHCGDSVILEYVLAAIRKGE